MSDAAIVVEGLGKTFGSVVALSAVDLQVPRGSVLGLLGPNGAGKTTAVRIMTTLLRPDTGRVVIEGRDVVREPDAVRRVIGLAGQSAAIKEELTGRENLVFTGRLYHMARARCRERASELLERFDLADAADRQARTYSGGMQRRLDLAASLVAEPPVLFLDEPTTGLDPRSRIGMWSVIRDLVSGGTTLLLTTQYLEEADELADQIAVIDHGTVIASGTSDSLKDQVGGDVIEFDVPDREAIGRASQAVAALSDVPPVIDAESSHVTVRIGRRGSQALIDAVRLIDQAGVEVSGLAIHRPSLDDVFLSLTGHAASPTLEDTTAARRARRGRRRPDTAEEQSK
ncbi:MAG: ATP-binding cassette domain-containing protein [Acidimicrobiales bacterium]